MGKLIRDQKLLYHLTSLNNIESIFKNGLLSRNSIKSLNSKISFIDIAEKDIINFRNRTNISNLIPFHFFVGTPFAGNIQRTHQKDEFIYITIHRDLAKEKKFKIFPTHPRHMKPLKLYDYDEGMQAIDWELMQLRDYSNHECKEVCMSECVSSHKNIPASSFHSIVVKSQATKDTIERLYLNLFNTNCKQSFFINIEPSWFVSR